MKILRVVFLFFFVVFIGCSTKINPNEFHKTYAQKSKFLPKESEIKAKPKVLIFKVEADDYLLEHFKNSLESVILKTSAILLKRKKTSLEEEIILSQESKLTNSDINSADYLIFARITSKHYSYKYHKGYYYKDSKGKTHYQPPYYSYEACVSGEVKILKLPENYIEKTFNFHACSYEESKNFVNIKKELLIDALKKGVYSLKDQLKAFFTKKGYVLDVRKKEDMTIVKITLGKEDGLEDGDEVEIYTIKEYINPLTNKPTREIVKIAEGEVSNAINPQTSWVIIESQNEPIKIGDIVKIKYNVSFFKRLFR